MQNGPPLIRTAKSICIGLHRCWVEGSPGNTECRNAFESLEVECLNMGLHNSVLASQSRLALVGKWGAHAGMLESMLGA
eukprot:1153099-Pelagomonas_calceolata.AAC.1